MNNTQRITVGLCVLLIATTVVLHNPFGGYEREQVTGNAYVLLNLQYLAPWPGYESFRYVVFTDIGNAYKNVRHIDLGDLESSVGIGFRWKLRSFVKTYLRLDWAYGLGSDEAKVYGSTSAMF